MLGADKAYDVEGIIGDRRARGVTPHVAINGTLSKLGKPRKTALDKRTTRHPDYGVSGRKRKCFEEIFGWAKFQTGFSKSLPAGRALPCKICPIARPSIDG